MDQGGQSTRAAIYDNAGGLLALGRASIDTQRPAPDRVEHDPRDLVASVDSAIQAALAALPAGSKLCGAALATQRSTFVCADRIPGEALSPILSWQDRRGARELQTAFGASARRIQSLTGLRLSPHYGAGKLRWCLAHLPAVQRASASGRLVAAPLASFLLRHFCAGHAWQIDPVNASRLLLLDVEMLDWSSELLQIFGLNEGLLPVVRPSRFAYGRLRLQGADVPLSVSTGDQAAALFCEGAPAAGTVFINIGTGAFIQCATGETAVRDERLLSSIAWHDAATRIYVLEGTVNGAASAVEGALRDLGLVMPEAPQLEAVLAQISTAPLYLNGVSGLGSPDWVPNFASRFLGEGSPLARLAAVYESIVFLIMRNLDAMRGRLALKRIVLTGGIAKVDWLARCLASLSRLPVERPADAEATLRGLRFLLTELGTQGASPGQAILAPAEPGRLFGSPGRPYPGQSASAAAGSGTDLFLPEAMESERTRYRAWTRELETALGRE